MDASHGTVPPPSIVPSSYKGTTYSSTFSSRASSLFPSQYESSEKEEGSEFDEDTNDHAVWTEEEEPDSNKLVVLEVESDGREETENSGQPWEEGHHEYRTSGPQHYHRTPNQHQIANIERGYAAGISEYLRASL